MQSLIVFWHYLSNAYHLSTSACIISLQNASSQEYVALIKMKYRIKVEFEFCWQTNFCSCLQYLLVKGSQAIYLNSKPNLHIVFFFFKAIIILFLLKTRGRGHRYTLWLIHVDVQEKPKQYCEAIILKLKINKFNYKKQKKKKTSLSRQFLSVYKVHWMNKETLDFL